MARDPILNSEVDADSPLDEDLLGKIQGNDNDHEQRILALEDPSVLAFSHFASGSEELQGLARVQVQSAQWIATIGGGGSFDNTLDQHYLELRDTTNAGSGGTVYGTPRIYYDLRVKPVIFKCRMKFVAADDHWSYFAVGFTDELTPDNSRSPNLIALEAGSTAGQWRFVSRYDGGTETLGSDFAQVADGTWFEVRIDFTDVGGDRALCYIDGVLKETITLTLPVDRIIVAGARFFRNTAGSSGVKVLVDRMEVRASGALTDAA